MVAVREALGRSGRGRRPPHVALRRVDAGDCLRLWRWVNRAEARAASLQSTDPISWATHRAWFAKKLADPRARLWIVLSCGRPAGYLRLDARPPAVSIFVAPQFRRHGVARAALALALEEGPLAGLDLKRVVARVRTRNQASRRLFRSLGFVEAERHADHVLFERWLAKSR